MHFCNTWSPAPLARLGNPRSQAVHCALQYISVYGLMRMKQRLWEYCKGEEVWLSHCIMQVFNDYKKKRIEKRSYFAYQIIRKSFSHGSCCSLLGYLSERRVSSTNSLKCKCHPAGLWCPSVRITSSFGYQTKMPAIISSQGIFLIQLFHSIM